MLVEESQRHLLAIARIPLIAQVGIVNVGGLEVIVAHHIAAEVKIIEYRRRQLSKLGPVGRAAIGCSELMTLGEVIGDIG